MADIISEVLKFLVLALDISIISFGFFVLFSGENRLSKVKSFLRKNSLAFAFLIALVAMFGSLYYSEIMGYSPCSLCWYQRIMMYPLVLLLGIAIHNKDESISTYVMPMAFIGAFISAWHYMTQVTSINSAICSIGGESCANVVSFSYGYISIPMMALTGFFAIIILMSISKKR